MYSLRNKNNPLFVILVAGLTAGTLDILAASVQVYIVAGKMPDVVLKFVASGMFGRAQAMAGGRGMEAWGLFFHYMAALSFAALFVVIYLRWKWIRQHIWLAGILYGVFAWTVMNQLVVPMSRIGHLPFVLKKALIALAIIICMIGIPIAWITSHFYPENK